VHREFAGRRLSTAVGLALAGIAGAQSLPAYMNFNRIGSVPQYVQLGLEMNAPPNTFWTDTDHSQLSFELPHLWDWTGNYLPAGWTSMGMKSEQERYRGADPSADNQSGLIKGYANLRYNASWVAQDLYPWERWNPHTGIWEPWTPRITARCTFRIVFRKTASLSTYAECWDIDPDDPAENPAPPFARAFTKVGTKSKRSNATGWNTRDYKPTTGWDLDGGDLHMDIVFTNTRQSSTWPEFVAPNVKIPTSVVESVTKAFMERSEESWNVLSKAIARAIGKSRIEMKYYVPLAGNPTILTGTISMQGLTSAQSSSRGVAFELRGSWGELAWWWPVVGVDADTGEFELGMSADSGTYALYALAKGYLKKRVVVSVTAGQDVSGLSFANLYAGDVDGNNVINAADESVVSGYVGKSLYSDDWEVPNAQGIAPRDCDFDLDGYITSLDVAMVTINLGRVGD